MLPHTHTHTHPTLPSHPRQHNTPGNINQLTTIDALSQPYKHRPSLGPGGCPPAWYDPEALGRIAAACPETSRLVDIVLEEGSQVYLGSSAGQREEQGGEVRWCCFVVMGFCGGCPVLLLLLLPPAHAQLFSLSLSLQQQQQQASLRPRRHTSALLSDSGAVMEMCRKLGRGFPLTAGLSTGELSK